MAEEVWANDAMFGAKGDGFADDTLGLQAAIDYAMQRSIPVVRLAPGRYRTTSTIPWVTGRLSTLFRWSDQWRELFRRRCLVSRSCPRPSTNPP